MGSLFTRELPYHKGEFRRVTEGLTALSSDLLTLRSNASLSGHTSPASNLIGCAPAAGTHCA
jgi:hypothetical protein